MAAREEDLAAIPRRPLEVLEAPPRPRTRIHFDIAPEVQGTDVPEFEMHVELALRDSGIQMILDRAMRGALREVLGEGARQEAYNNTILQILEHFLPNRDANPEPVPAARAEVRFTPLPNGFLRCSQCQQEVAAAVVAGHARGHGAGAVHEEVAMHEVVSGTGPQGRSGVAPADDGVNLTPEAPPP